MGAVRLLSVEKKLKVLQVVFVRRIPKLGIAPSCPFEYRFEMSKGVKAGLPVVTTHATATHPAKGNAARAQLNNAVIETTAPKGDAAHYRILNLLIV